jgi:CubicO group peptidase (beta-lactamase class C family)
MSRLALITIGATSAVLIAIGCAPPSTQRAAPRMTNARDSAAVDSIARRFFAMDLAPGMAVAVVRGDEVLYLGGFGFADREQNRRVTPETIFYIASTTKAFTGLAAAIMHERGRFNLDAPLSRYLPDARLQTPLAADSITIRSLLSHTHGISNDGPIVWRTAFSGEFDSNEQLVGLLTEHGPARTGRAYQYGNIGYNIASFAMDRALGKSWKDVLAEEIFRPLDMRSSGAYVSRAPEGQLAMPYSTNGSVFERVPYGKSDANMQAAGGLLSNARDLARWLEAQLNGGRVDGRQVLSAKAVAEAQRLQATASANIRGMQQVGYSLGWQLVQRGSDTLYIHGGGFSGFSTLISFLPRQRLGVAVMANDAVLGSALTDAVTRALYTHFAGPAEGAIVPENFDLLVQNERQAVAADRARRASRSQVLLHPLEAYAGVYTNPSVGSLELRVVDGRLRAISGAAQSAVEVFDASKNQLRVALTGGGTVMTVEMENGRAVRLRWGGNTFARR